jgi:DNA-directed RNA polymerase specialized sigma24 family protein
MIHPEAYDAFYKDARARLLLQTYVLTGDLPAARSAVRDSFIVTWHHWRKVSRLPDPEAWVRPHAWAQAQRRHTARIWHRDKSLDPEARATFDALGTLPMSQRKALLLDQTTSLPMAERARELGLTLGEAERLTQAATGAFCEAREVGPGDVPLLFGHLATLVTDTRLPRASILRRAGAARRRTHTVVGAAVAVAAVVVTGTVVSGSTVEGGSRLRGEDQGVAASGPDGSPSSAFTPARLLEAEEVGHAVGGDWTETRTSDNSRGSGRVAPCQQDRYADPQGVSTLVRTFESEASKARPAATAVQYAELSRTTTTSRKAWERMLRWYGGCVTPMTQLMGTYAVSGIGDEAMLFHLRSWKGSGETYVFGVARTGQIVTTTLNRTAGTDDPDLGASVDLLGASINGLCRTTPNAKCAADPKAEPTDPVKVGSVPGLLVEADLPPLVGVAKPWVGTEPREARSNTASTRCDRADFSQGFVTNAVTRTFLVPQARLPAAFGLTETVGTMPEARAQAFVDDVRDKMASCPDRDAGSEVESLATDDSGDTDLSLWRVTFEVSDDETVTYLMGISRRGGTVGQIGFVPGGGVYIEADDFDALVRRSLARLDDLPRKRR